MINFNGPSSLRSLLRGTKINSREGVSIPCLRCCRHFQKTFSTQKQTHQKLQPQPKARLHEKIRDSILVVEAKQGPLGKTFVGIGQGLCTGGLVFGCGSVLFYSLSDQKPSIIDEYGEYISSSPSSTFTAPGAMNVPEYVRDRVNTAYMYMMTSLGVSMVGAAASFRLFRNMAFLNVISANPVTALGVTIGSQLVLATLVRTLPYHEGFGLKQAGSVAQALLIGLAAAPMYLFGAQSLIRAGFVTAGAIGGLTGLSTIVPQDTFVNWQIPCKLGMYTVFLSFAALYLLPRRHIHYNLFYKMAIHGGLVVFPAYYLYNTKNVVRSAMYSAEYDPINASMPLFTDIINIYGRLAFILPPHYFISGDTGKITWAAHNQSKPE